MGTFKGCQAGVFGENRSDSPCPDSHQSPQAGQSQVFIQLSNIFSSRNFSAHFSIASNSSISKTFQERSLIENIDSSFSLFDNRKLAGLLPSGEISEILVFMTS